MRMGYANRMPNVGPMEIAALLLLALMLFGAKRLPEIGRSLGSGMREFKDSVTGKTNELGELTVGTTEAAVHSPASQDDSVH